MRGDRPEPAGGGRDPLGDLRERLARLPAGHPSSPDYRPPQQQGEDANAGRDDLGHDDLGHDDVGHDDLGHDDLGHDVLGRAEEVAGEGSAGRQDTPGGPHPRGAARPEGTRRSHHGQAASRVPGPGQSPGGEPYRPWFSSGDEPDLWFSPDSGDRSG